MLAAESPEVERGDRIAVWVSTDRCRGVVVLSDVAVQEVSAPRSGALSSSAATSITVRVAPDLAARVMQALDLRSAVVRVGVLSGASTTAGPLSDLAVCQADR